MRISKEKREFKNKEHLIKPTEKKLKIPKFLDYMQDKKVKLERLEECGNYIRFFANLDKSKYKLSGGSFCNNRFCPFCSWIKAKKNAYQILELLKFIEKREDKKFIFVTLTSPNVPKERLSQEITDFNKSFKRLFELKEFERINQGFVRKLEITYNEERNDYNPHFHVIVAVNKSYFTSRDYLKKKRLLELWQHAKRDKSITQVDIRPLKMDTIKDVLEIATYSTKQSDLYRDKEIFDVFYHALKGRQIITYNGLFKTYRKLQEDGELSALDDEDLLDIIEFADWEVWYQWKHDRYKEKEELLLYLDNMRDGSLPYFYGLDVEIE